jgi:thioredoxin reductase (NADPH)
VSLFPAAYIKHKEYGEAMTENTIPEEYDVAIIGGGPAGASAAIYTARAGLRTLVLDKGLTAGALGMTGKIANYPGISEAVSGAELLSRIRDQARSFGAEFITDKVIGVDLQPEKKAIFGNLGTYSSKTVILATGSMGRGARVKGEDELLGRGVSYCATCDAAFFRDKEVVVAGSSDEAIEEALYLTRFVKQVHFLCPTPELKAPQEMIDELTANARVKLLKGAALKEIIGQERVEAVLFSVRGEPDQKLPVSAAFVYLMGGMPVTDFLQGQLTLSDKGCLHVDKEFQTSIPGVFAVGDLLCDHVKQAVISAAEGAIAGMAVEKVLRGKKQIAVDWAK